MLLKLYKTNQHTQKTDNGVQTVKLKQNDTLRMNFGSLIPVTSALQGLLLM